MTTLQNDLLEIYNSLVAFSDSTVKSSFAIPITVHYEKESHLLVFEQKGISVRLGLPVYYCLGLEDMEKPTYLLPEDYDFLMYNLMTLIQSGELIKERTLVSPENYGFDVYSVNLREFWKGPDVIGKVRFISGNSWLFKFLVRRKYKL
jgi:hypothetical protein